MSALGYPTIAIGAIFALYVLIRQAKRRTGGPSLPPGPKSLPFVGNVMDMPIEKQWLTYHDWHKKYGDIVSFKVFGTQFIILGSLNRTNDLFEKRSSLYSSRPRMPMLMELMKWDYIMPFLPYGDLWRRHRRMFHDQFHPNVVGRFHPVQVRGARRFLVSLHSSPESLFSNVRRAFVSIIMTTGYGLEANDENNRFVAMAEEALEGLTEAGIPGRFLVDLLPILKYIPSWIPGASFQKFGEQMRRVNHSVEVEAWNEVKEQMKRGTAVPSLATTLIENLPHESDAGREEMEKIARGVASAVYIGGTDTTVSSIKYFFLAMTHYPEVLRKAQAEIDTVIGSDRLPEFSDRDSLPYINAIAKETTRWIAVTPLAVGHMAVEDDVYDGYFIPKGTILLGNVWSILRDPEAYPEPEKFNPERFLKDGKLDKSVRDPALAAFGFGRRICPGRHFSDNSLFIFIASIVAVYNILPPVDEFGNPIEQKPDITGGLITSPLPFKCIIKPRSARAEALIHDEHDLEL